MLVGIFAQFKFTDNLLKLEGGGVRVGGDDVGRDFYSV